jgi:phosphatidylglycerol lysyltransferase
MGGQRQFEVVQGPPNSGLAPRARVTPSAAGPQAHTQRGGLLALIATVLVFSAALFVLERSLGATSLRSIARSAGQLPAWRLVLCGLFTLGSYATLTLYDVLALRVIDRRLPYAKVALTSFTAYGLANTLGVSSLSGGSVRLKAYTGLGLGAMEVASVQLLCSLTFFLGAICVAGVGMLFGATHAAQLLHVSVRTARAGGGLLLLVLFSYAWLTYRLRRPLRIAAWSVTLPSWRATLAQVAIGCSDLAFAAASLYVLLPAHAGLSFGSFYSTYTTSVTVGAVSNVPGGLGVFESGLLLLLPSLPVKRLLGAVLVYRAVYSLLPFVIALGMLAGRELMPLRAQLGGHGRRLLRWSEAFAPQLLASVVFGAGALLTFSAATPSVAWRREFLQDVLPLPVLEVSHLLGSLFGVALMLLARGLYRRLDAAYYLVQALLLSAVVASLLKGIDYEESLLLMGVVGLLYGARRRFTRHAALLVLSWRWLLQISLVVGTAVCIGLIAYRNVAYSHELWWQFAFDAGASRMLRAAVVSALLVASTTLWFLLQPHRPPTRRAQAQDLARVSAGLANADDPLACLALLGDKQLLFADGSDAFIMYGGSGRSLVALGDPVGPASARSELAWRYRELCDQCGMQCVFYQVRPEMLPLYLDLGLSLAKLGEEAHVSLPDFHLNGRDRADLRTAQRKVSQGEHAFRVLEPYQVSARMAELAEVSNAWLAHKPGAEKGFSIGRFVPHYIERFPCAVVEQAGRIVAFSNVLTSGDKQEIAIDLMRYTDDAPSGVMDGLLVHLMLWARARDYRWFNLGMAPLSGLYERPLSPLWHKAGLAMHTFAQSYYNFEGLRRYKQKFHPEWRPRYLASPGGLALPRVMFDTTTLIAGGIKAIVSK